MRRLPVVLALVCFAAVAYGQASDTVKLVSPTDLAISPTGDVTTVRVFYTAPAASHITITNAGPLVAGEHIGFVKQAPYRAFSFDLKVKLRKLALKAGETHSGSIIFTVDTTSTVIPFTVTRPAPAFTATATPTDICIGCSEPRAISVQITNSGQATLGEITVGTVLMSDASRGHRWILPRAKGRRCGEPNTKASEVDGKLVVEPCSSVKVALRPGEARTISIAVKPPQFAGDYATTIELSAEGVPTNSVSLVTRVRGPWGGTWWPGLLFVLTVFAGFWAAHWLEKYFGVGGVAGRTKALIALHRIREELVAIQKWAEESDKTPLTNTRTHIQGNIGDVDLLMRDAPDKSADALEKELIPLTEALQKRRKLQQWANYALSHGMAAKLEDLDKVSDAGTPEEYGGKLKDALLTASNADVRESAEAFRAESERQRTVVDELRKNYGRMLLLRGAILLIVSLITAYGMFYANGCNFGSLANYFAVFLWGLGLTQAGNALINEVRSRANAPAEPTPTQGGGGSEAG